MVAIRPLVLSWSTTARSDMRRIYRHILSESRSADIADRFVVDLETKIRSLAISGFSGVPRDDIAESLRAFPYRDRCFYFRIHDEQLIVARVLHGRQDVSPEHFKKA